MPSKKRCNYHVFPSTTAAPPWLSSHERHARYQCGIALLMGEGPAPSFQERKRKQAGWWLLLWDKITPILLDLVWGVVVAGVLFREKASPSSAMWQHPWPQSQIIIKKPWHFADQLSRCRWYLAWLCASFTSANFASELHTTSCFIFTQFFMSRTLLSLQRLLRGTEKQHLGSAWCLRIPPFCQCHWLAL